MTRVLSSAVIWEALIRKNKAVVTTDELSSLARRVSMNPRHAIDHLVRADRLEPLFKGTYYVRRPEEILLNVQSKNELELFALAARAKDIGRWYFGLHTALKMHGLTHEWRSDVEVISERIYRIRGIDIAGTHFVIHKWAPSLFGYGITRVRGLPVSDPARTVMDLAYSDYWAKRKRKNPTGEWRTYLDRVDRELFRHHLDRAPRPFRRWVESSI